MIRLAAIFQTLHKQVEGSWNGMGSTSHTWLDVNCRLSAHDRRRQRESDWQIEVLGRSKRFVMLLLAMNPPLAFKLSNPRVCCGADSSISMWSRPLVSLNEQFSLCGNSSMRICPYSQRVVAPVLTNDDVLTRRFATEETPSECEAADQWEDFDDLDEFHEWVDTDNSEFPEENSESSPEENEEYMDFFDDVLHVLAQSEQTFLGQGEILPPMEPQTAASSAATVKQMGVVRITNALSTAAAANLREFILEYLAEVGDVKLNHEGELLDERQSAVRTPSAGSDAPQTRWELRLPMCQVVRAALMELLGKDSVLGDTLEIVAGGCAAKLWELSAIISAPGAGAQNVHADVTAPELTYATLVALQPISRDLGPTRFLPGTHLDPAAHAVIENTMDVTQLSAPGEPPPLNYVGLLDTGDAQLYDGRVLHCGGANNPVEQTLRTKDVPADGLRVCFGFVFMKAGMKGEGESRSILPHYQHDRMNLSWFRRS